MSKTYTSIVQSETLMAWRDSQLLLEVPISRSTHRGDLSLNFETRPRSLITRAWCVVATGSVAEANLTSTDAINTRWDIVAVPT